MKQSRPYQQQADRELSAKWAAGKRSLLLVAPTGAGKTFVGATIGVRSKRVLWAAHRTELVEQAAAQLRELVGRENVGEIRPGAAPTPSARVQVASAMTLLKRGVAEDVDLLVLDEAHHYVAESFREIARAYPKAKILGLTATPMRETAPYALGDVFEDYVAIRYSDLLADGSLVAPVILAPEQHLGHDVAEDPIAAWLRYCNGRRTFAFWGRVHDAIGAKYRFKHRGVSSDVIEAATGAGWRRMAIDAFRAGHLLVLNNVYALTEGIDVPEADAILSCRPFYSVANMIQAFGRIMRPHPAKARPIILDLCGATRLHGRPDIDREYSLTNEEMPISGAAASGVIDGDGPSVWIQQIKAHPLSLVGGDFGVALDGITATPPKGVIDEVRVKRIGKKFGRAQGLDEARVSAARRI